MLPAYTTYKYYWTLEVGGKKYEGNVEFGDEYLTRALGGERESFRF